MINTDENIRIYDDTGSGDSFDIESVLYEDDTIIIGLVVDEMYEYPLKVMIEKDSRTVSNNELNFYYAENYTD